MKLSKLLIGISLAAGMSVSAGVAVGTANAKNDIKVAEAAVSSTVTRVYIEDQVNANTTLLAIESISFASGYSHTHWRDFLTSYLGTRSSYTTTGGSTQPTSKGWSYMSNSEQEKYLLCPTGAKNFTMIFPEWVTAFSYKAVGNNFYNWFEVNGSAVGVHSSWGYGKQLKDYIYDSSGWTMNVVLDDTSQTYSWGDISITAIATDGTNEIERKTLTVSKYYIASKNTYDIFGYTFGGWYSNAACTTSHTSLITASTTLYAKETVKKEAYLAGTMNSWNTTDDNYLLAPGEDSQYKITVNFAEDAEFKVVYNGDWYGWEQVDQTSKLVTSGAIESNGGNIKVNSDIKLEIYFKTAASSNRIWIQQDSASEAETYAKTFLASITCTSEATTFAINVWNTVGSATTSMEYKFDQLTVGAQNVLKGAEADEDGSAVEQAVARYDRILGKYGYGTASGQYHDFMGRKPASLNPSRSIMLNSGVSSSLLITVATVIGLTAVGGYFLLHKKKED